MRICKFLIVAVGVLATGLATQSLFAQTRIRQPSIPQRPLTGNVGTGVTKSTVTTSTAALTQPTFDPYATVPTVPTVPPNAATVPPSLPGTTGSTSPRPVFGAAPTTPAPTITTTPGTALPSWPAGTDPVAPSTVFPNTGYPAYPQQPSALFPNGVTTPAWCQNWAWPQAQEGRYMRLFQDLRLTHTWLGGGDGPEELGVDETEVGTTVNFPNFFWSGQPLHVSPVFTMTWFDGPETTFAGPNAFPTELPPRVYGTYLDFAWQPQITQQFSADLDVSVGVFSDFEGFTSDSVRIQGTALGVLAVTPTTTLLLGATYLDRVDIKLLPAGGIVYMPNPQTRWDIYFPRPKVSRYLTTVGNTDIWIYLNAEYGGGSWTIRRAGADDRRMDMNDFRVGGGFEWTHQFGLRSFVEAAYVFERELVFASGLPVEHDLDDTIMIRGGLVY